VRAKEIVGPIEGGCQCGAVRYRLDGKLYTLAVCHCTMCQRQSASAFGMSLAISRNASWLEPDAHFWTRSKQAWTPIPAGVPSFVDDA
jgi:hypothetical protein